MTFEDIKIGETYNVRVKVNKKSDFFIDCVCIDKFGNKTIAGIVAFTHKEASAFSPLPDSQSSIVNRQSAITKAQLTARVAELETLAAPALDTDFPNIVVSAVRYALPRHSYMPSLTREYVWRHWPRLSKMHWCILRDIREHYHDVINIYQDRKELMPDYDTNEWVDFYNRLIKREDTNLTPYEREEHKPLAPIK